MQQYRLLPLLASSYIFHFTGRFVKNTLTNMQLRLLSSTQKDHPTKIEMQDFHATTSALKSFCTTISSDGIEDCRKACGGHGYLVSSGLVELSNTYLSNNTVEGDNYMLPQHVIKVLLKLVPAVQGIDNKQQLDKLKYAYKNCYSYYLIDPLYDMIHNTATTAKNSNNNNTINIFDNLTDDTTIPFLLKSFAHRSARLLLQIAKSIEDHIVVGNKTLSEAWNLSLILMHNASQAHALYILLHNFHILIMSKEKNSQNSHNYDIDHNAVRLGINEICVLKQLGQLFGYYWIHKEKGDYLFDRYFTSDQITYILQNIIINRLLPIIRTNVIGLVDAWDFTDFQLKSALGNYNGNVYQEIMNSAHEEPLNHNDDGYIKYLKDLIVGDVAVWKGDTVIAQNENKLQSKL